MIYWKLFAEFFKVSCFTFGGAYGAIALIRDMVLSNGWLTEERLSHMIAVSESTPGPIMVNLATYIGNDQAGFAGALIATIAVVLPAFLIILLVTGLLKSALKNRYVQAVLQGVKPCMVGLVTATGLYMTAQCSIPSGNPDWRAIIIAGFLVGTLVLYRHLRKKKLSPITLILLSALLGMLIY